MHNNEKNQADFIVESFFLTVLLALSLWRTLSVGVKAQNKSVYTGKKNLVTFEPPKGNKPQQTVGLEKVAKAEFVE